MRLLEAENAELLAEFQTAKDSVKLIETKVVRIAELQVRHTYLHRKYEAKDEKTGTTLIAMQPLVADQAYMPQMKAMCVPFHMVYGRLMCY